MTTRLLYANNAAGTLLLPITATQTTFTLNAGQAAAFPTPGGGQAFYCTLVSVTVPTQFEIVLVTSNASSVFTVVRAQDGTTAAAFNSGDIVSQRAVRAEMIGWENAAEGNFAAPAVAVSPSTTLGVVGTTLADNANAGSVGEYLTATGSSPLTTGSNQTFNAASFVLTPGDWDVWGNCISDTTSAVTQLSASISLVSGAQGVQGTFNRYFYPPPGGTGGDCVSTPTVRVNISVPTSVYLVFEFSGTAPSGSVVGFVSARRVR